MVRVSGCINILLPCYRKVTNLKTLLTEANEELTVSSAWRAALGRATLRGRPWPDAPTVPCGSRMWVAPPRRALEFSPTCPAASAPRSMKGLECFNRNFLLTF